MNRSLLAHFAAAAVIAASVSAGGLGHSPFRSIGASPVGDGVDSCTSAPAAVRVDSTDREVRLPGPRPRQLHMPR